LGHLVDACIQLHVVEVEVEDNRLRLLLARLEGADGFGQWTCIAHIINIIIS
jgi:hypothetical protein